MSTEGDALVSLRRTILHVCQAEVAGVGGIGAEKQEEGVSLEEWEVCQSKRIELFSSGTWADPRTHHRAGSGYVFSRRFTLPTN